MLGFLEQWFGPVTASQDYRRQHYIALLVMIAAGALLRFWHLGNVGLHGDEDIMGLAARGIVAHGIPVLPSDMVYWRAPLHTYLIAGSTLLFGDTEWALRLPSAIVGSLCGLLAFFLGRRFLDPVPNLGFTAAVTFLPAMIEISQTARMYVFFVACLLGYAILLFRWERNRSMLAFTGTVFMLIVATHFHRLAVFAAPMLLYPGLANRSGRQFLQAMVGIAVAAWFSQWTGDFSNQDYPDESERLEPQEEDVEFSVVGSLLADNIYRFAAALALVSVCALLTLNVQAERGKSWPAVAFVVGGVVACLLLHYHVGLIAVALGCLFWYRAGVTPAWRLGTVLATLGAVAAIQTYLVAATGEFVGREIVGAFVGTPSVWPTLRFLQFSPPGAVVVIAAIMVAAYEFSRGRKLPVYFLYFLIAVWGPLFLIGAFRWYAASRYTLGPLPFFLLAVFASAAYLLGRYGLLAARQGVGAIATCTLLAIAVIDPVATWATAKNGYDRNPDHKGPAQFVKSLELGDADVIIAEDSIVQTYYLGHVDYRLLNVVAARKHAYLRRDTLYGQYTGTPIITTGEEYLRVMNEARGNVYVIGSGQTSPDVTRRNRGNGIGEILSSRRFEVLFTGRDGKSIVWQLNR
jgi:hypothetical protein